MGGHCDCCKTGIQFDCESALLPVVQSLLSEDPAGNEIPVVAMETVPTVRRIMDIGTDDGTMGMDMIGTMNCAAMVGAAANAYAISVFVV